MLWSNLTRFIAQAASVPLEGFQRRDMIKHTIIGTKKLRYCKMMGTISLVDLYYFALKILDDPVQPLDVLLFAEKSCWESFHYKNDLIEIFESIGKKRIGKKMAVVIPNSYINNDSYSPMNNIGQKSIQIRYFQTEDEAMFWLER